MAGRQPTVAQLRPALQLALEVATATSGPLPGRVRNLVRNRRLPASWPVTIRHAIDEDEEFRSLVCSRADEPSLGRLGWLWLARPEGWEEQVDALVGEKLAARAQQEEQEREARLAAGRIAELEGDLARARAETMAASASSAAMEAELAASRLRVAELEEQLGSALAASHAAAAAASADAGELEALRRRSDSLQADHDGQQRLIAALRAELERTREDRDRAEADARFSAAERTALQAARCRTEAEAADLRRSLGAAIGRAAAAAREMGDSMAEASRLLAGETSATPAETAAPSPGRPGPGRAAGESPAPGPDPSESPTDAPGRHSPARARPAARGERRRPLSLPPAVLDDSPEAASHLVRVPGVNLVVDGYNVTFTSWTGDDLPALRHRLVAALSEFAVRLKRQVTVVFDGADDGGRVAAPPVARPWLRILFSASSVEADEVIVDAVRALPARVPVVVVSNDRRVGVDVGRLGANVLSVDQFLVVLGRQPDGPGPP